MIHDPWTDRLSEYLDDELAPAERAAADEHLLACAECRDVLAGLRRVTMRAATLRDTAPSPALWNGVAARIAPPDELAARRRVRAAPPLRWIAGVAAVLALGVGIGRALPRGGDVPAAQVAARTDPYRVAALEHLARSQAMLTSFQRTEGGVALWADDLLSNTRLLMDSPAADDPALRRLLQDLELVLVQIAQLHGSPAPRAETEMARDALDRSGVLGRMRAVVPAGTAATTQFGET